MFILLFLIFGAIFSRKPDHRSFEPGKLSISESVVGTYNLPKGFSIEVSESFVKIIKSFSKDNEVTVFQNSEGSSYLGMEMTDYSIDEHSGMFIINDGSVQSVCKDQTINQVQNSSTSISFSGFLQCESLKIAFSHELKVNEKDHLCTKVVVEDTEAFNVLHFSQHMTSSESVHGFGMQNTYWNLQGQQIEIITSEHGVGRGEQIVTELVDDFYNHGGGTPTKSYSPVPLFYTDSQWGFFLRNTGVSIFDFVPTTSSSKGEYFNVASYNQNVLDGVYYVSNDVFLMDLIQQHVREIGSEFAPVIPDWFHSGLIFGVQGGTARVEELVAKLIGHGVKVAGVWMQDWSGTRLVSHSDHEKRLIWNWDLNQDLYPDWDGMVERFKEKGIKVLTYINAQLVNAENITGYSVNYWDEAIENGYMVRKCPYEKNIPYTFLNVFNATIFDLTNPKTRQYVKKIIKEMIQKYKSSGYMLDFGEYTPLDACFYDSEKSVHEIHNEYPVEWAKINREVVREIGMDDEIVFFTRSGGALSANYTITMWAGDQLVAWDMYDGLKSSVTSLVTCGLSGMPNVHSDIGGYTSFAIMDLIHICRSKSLLWRWAEVNAFTQAFRSHEGMDPQDNFQIYSDDETLDFFARMTKIFNCFFDYRKQMMQITRENGVPIHRHLQMDYPKDPNVKKLIGYEQFLFGSDFLIAPITDHWVDSKNVYLPEGTWRGLFDNATFDGNKEYHFAKVEHGKPKVFFKEESEYGEFIQRCVLDI